MNQENTLPVHRPADKWVLRGGSLSVLVDRHATPLFLTLAVLCGAFTAVALMTGSEEVTLSQALSALSGRGDAVASLILFEIRLPRMVSTLLAGFSLGLAGCISQTIFRNRLATPDVLGINEGATLAIVAFVLFMATASWPVWIAPVGALIAVFLLYQVCGAGDAQGPVLLVTGICLMEFLRAVVEFMMSTGALHEVQNIYVWMQGSFIGQGYSTSLPVLVVLLLTLPLQFWLGRHLDFLRLPHGVAETLGINVRLMQRACVATVAVLAALGSAIGGPVAFVAMASPVIVSALVRGRTPALWCAGLTGAVILMISDTLARTLAAPQEVAAGVVTRILGGLFLLYFLMRHGAR